MSLHYYSAKNLQICPQCGETPTEPHVYCDTCLEKKSPGRALMLQMKSREPQVEKVKVHAVACCGLWHEITETPMVTSCGHTHFVLSVEG